MTSISGEILLSYACEKGEFSYTTLLNDFVAARKCAKETLLNYKKSLETEGKLKKKLSPTTGRPVYYVPEKIRKQREATHAFAKLVESAKPEEMAELIDKLQKEIDRLRYREEFISISDRVTSEIGEFYSLMKLESFGIREPLKGFKSELNEFKDKGAVLMKTLDDALKKGWITDNEREIYVYEYPDFVKALAEFTKAIDEGKVKVYYLGLAGERLENPCNDEEQTP